MPRPYNDAIRNLYGKMISVTLRRSKRCPISKKIRVIRTACGTMVPVTACGTIVPVTLRRTKRCPISKKIRVIRTAWWGGGNDGISDIAQIHAMTDIKENTSFKNSLWNYGWMTLRYIN